MSRTPYDPTAFRQFEYEGWERLSAGYHRHWQALTTQVVPDLLAVADVASGAQVLDVACGPGYVSAAAAARGATTRGVDFSENMNALARRNFPELEFQTADAEDLPFADESFDAVLINFGVLHFPNPETALSEAHRVLKSGGRLAFTNWAEAENSAISIAMKAIAEKGSLKVGLPPGTPLYRFADPDECRTVLTEVGFTSVVSREIQLTWHLPRPDMLMETFQQATARMSGLLNAQDPEKLPDILAAMTAGCAPYERDGVTELAMPAALTVGEKL